METKKLLNQIRDSFCNREFWPSRLFHIPTFFIYCYFAIKAKHIFFFSSANPALRMGGFMDNAKEDIDKFIFPKYLINKKSFSKGSSVIDIKNHINKNNLSYPCIIKPQVGGRQGNNVYYIEKENDFHLYIDIFKNIDFIVEEYINGEEYSIYYYRNPNKKTSRILGVTKKIYPALLGNGTSTVGELIRSDARYNHYYKIFQNYNIDMTEIIPEGASKKISTIGNHCKGTMFIDRSYCSETEKTNITSNPPIIENSDIYLYRSDIKANSRNDVINGDYKVIEINGVFAEPTFIYDPNYKIINAYKQIYQIRHYTYKLALINYEKKKTYFPSLEGIKLIVQYLLLK